MAEIVKAHIRPGARILEPSVGLGRLYEPFADLDELRARWVAVENARECVRAVAGALRRVEIHERDFLETTAADLGGEFDAVIMNPPFKQGRDIKHIRHAYGMVRAGGVLVSLCYNGTKQNRDLRPLSNTWEVLPDGSFRAEGTSASVALIVLEK
jgi:16S rRNA G1207 methylase RsmC